MADEKMDPEPQFRQTFENFQKMPKPEDLPQVSHPEPERQLPAMPPQPITPRMR